MRSLCSDVPSEDAGGTQVAAAAVLSGQLLPVYPCRGKLTGRLTVLTLTPSQGPRPPLLRPLPRPLPPRRQVQ